MSTRTIKNALYENNVEVPIWTRFISYDKDGLYAFNNEPTLNKDNVFVNTNGGINKMLCLQIKGFSEEPALYTVEELGMESLASFLERVLPNKKKEWAKLLFGTVCIDEEN